MAIHVEVLLEGRTDPKSWSQMAGTVFGDPKSSKMLTSCLIKGVESRREL